MYHSLYSGRERLAKLTFSPYSRLDVSIRLRRSILHNDLLQLTRLLKNHPKYLPNPDALANSSLHLAAQSGHLPIVQYLITYTSHEDSGISRNTNGDTPLMLAAEGGHEEVVSMLAEMFGRVDYRNKAGATALILAARAGKDGVVRILLDGGSDIDAVDGLGNTALHVGFSCAEEIGRGDGVQGRELMRSSTPRHMAT